MPRRTRRWLWGARVTALAGAGVLAGTLAVGGLDAADQVGSLLGAAVAVLGLLAPYLLPPVEAAPGIVRDAGDALPAGPSGGPDRPASGPDLRGAQGVQINHAGGNTQHNTFAEPGPASGTSTAPPSGTSTAPPSGTSTGPATGHSGRR